MGAGEKSESENCIALCIYLNYQFKMQVPVVCHENVLGFDTGIIEEVAAQHNYTHVQISTKPMDVGFYIGRPRKHFVLLTSWLLSFGCGLTKGCF